MNVFENRFQLQMRVKPTNFLTFSTNFDNFRPTFDQFRPNFESANFDILKQIYAMCERFSTNFDQSSTILQEKKLSFSSKGKKIMSAEQIREFIMYYERITRQMLKDLNFSSDVVIKLDKKHRLNDIKFN